MIRKLIALSLLTLPLLARADLVGNYQLGPKQNVTIYYQDAKHVRLETPGQGYMLLTNGKMYTVVKRNGQNMVMDLEKMGEILQKYRNQQHQKPAKEKKPGKISISKTDQTETVAGYRGVVHRVTVDGKTMRMVLTNNRDVVKLTHGFMETMLKMGQTLTHQSNVSSEKVLQRIEKTGYGGLLKQQQGFELKSLKKEDKPDSFYALPKDAKMVQMPAMGQQ